MFSDITLSELDEFFSHIDFIPSLATDHPCAHMNFRSPYETKKRRTQQEMTPMHRFRGQLVSAQRMSLFLFKKIDPIYKSRIVTVCNMPSCVNPEHLEILHPTKEDQEEATDMERVF
jgi:hypothetical protein